MFGRDTAARKPGSYNFIHDYKLRMLLCWGCEFGALSSLCICETASQTWKLDERMFVYISIYLRTPHFRDTLSQQTMIAIIVG